MSATGGGAVVGAPVAAAGLVVATGGAIMAGRHLAMMNEGIDKSVNGSTGSPDRGGTRPPNMSPEGAGRKGAFNEAKRQSDVPTSQQPDRVGPNVDKRGEVQPGREYEYDVPAAGGGRRRQAHGQDSGRRQRPRLR